jgi:hypothetical protein
MLTLQIGNTTLLYSESDYTHNIGGSLINEHVSQWYAHPLFLGSLPDLTWGSIKKFVKENAGELRGSRFSNVENLLAIEETRDSTLAVKISSDYGSSASFLFTPTGNREETLEFGGILRGVFFPLGGSGTRLQVTLSGRSTRSSRRYQGGFGEEATGMSGGGYEIQSWDHRPSYKFMTLKKQVTKTYFGLELETNSQIPWCDMHHVMTQVEPKQEVFMYAKSDSSIHGKFDNSYEMVTHPMSPRRMRVEFKTFFTKLEGLLSAKNLKMSDVFDTETDSTGIHVHVSSEAFTGATRRFQGSHRKKFLMFWNMGGKANVEFTSKLARRDIKGHRYVRPSDSYDGRTPAWCLSSRGRPEDRYSACGDTGATLEVRAYRGQPTWEAVKHAVEATEAALRFTEVAPISAFSKYLPQAFDKWLGKQNRNAYRTLKENLKCV